VTPIDLVRLAELMRLAQGHAEIVVALIDGPVALDLPDFSGVCIRRIHGRIEAACAAHSAACAHGTFVAGVLAARRGSAAPAICPGCILLLYPIFGETRSHDGQMPSATSAELAEAIFESIAAGAKVVNLSVGLVEPSPKGESKLEEALDYASRSGVIIVAAAGNQGAVGSSAITRHPWVIPVAGCDLQGRPIQETNLGRSIGRWGLSAPGREVTSLGVDGKPRTFGGTSAAAPFVTGTIALLWSEFPGAAAAEIKLAVTRAGTRQRGAINPPVMDAWAAYQAMVPAHSRRRAQ
jgi:subtilisin family serine protease